MSIFDDIKKINEYGQEYRTARKLAKTLNYIDFGNFENVIRKAKITCQNSGQNVNDHFGDITEMVDLGSGSQRGFSSYKLSRYACYLIAMEAEGGKSEVALAKTYFAIQTRKQEMQDQYMEDNKRLYLREEMKTHNKKLMSTAKEAGVNNYANFNDAGYIGLYGMRVNQVKKVKKLEASDNLLDNIGSEELAANLFRATQTEAKIKRDGIVGQNKADLTHFEVGKKVRKTIQEIGGTMPEKLPTSDHIKEAKKRIKQQQKLSKK
ncbi:MAG: DNA damage-inducible protein D [Candidatus Absconditabacterales bacterium]